MPGLTATFYNYANGLPSPQIVASRTHPYIIWSWGGQPTAEVNSDYFMVVWTGVIKPSVSGNHTFQLAFAQGNANMQSLCSFLLIIFLSFFSLLSSPQSLSLQSP